MNEEFDSIALPRTHAVVRTAWALLPLRSYLQGTRVHLSQECLPPAVCVIGPFLCLKAAKQNGSVDNGLPR